MHKIIDVLEQILIVTTSRSFGDGIKKLGIEFLKAIKTPPPLEFLSLQ